MKKLLINVLLLSSVTAFAQPRIDSVKIALKIARKMVDHHSPKYDPKKAFSVYTQLALTGNAEAMNGLAVLYSRGIGTQINDQAALNWFNKSAQAGYAQSWANLGLIYKNGISVKQNFSKAYECYNKGATLNNGPSISQLGYMTYKGLGCAQSYDQALKLFKRGVALHDPGSYYMLGLCYRNGYGRGVNVDSAKFWLTKAAAWGDQRAVNELNTGDSENIDLKDIPNLQPPASSGVQAVNLKTGFKKIGHHLPKNNDVNGEYNGYVIKFDWSGKHIIAQEELRLRLQRKNEELIGQWAEEGQQVVSLSATVTDTALVFNNTGYEQSDHYHKTKPLSVIFNDSHLNLVKSSDTVYLTGTVRLYSPQTREPEKPEFIMLVRTDQKEHVSLDTAYDYNKQKADSVHFVAFPNPFSGPLKLNYTLKKDSRVSLTVSDLLNGKIIYRSTPEQLKAGDHTNVIELNAPPGNYVVTLNYGNKVKSAIVFKQ